MKISDEKLYELCKDYGSRARLWRQKFIGLLPEVNRRHLYEKKNYSSIFEFAAKLAGLSQEQVRLALNLEKRFEDKPTLKTALIQGEVSLNKLARVVSVATVENEADLAEKVRLLSKEALSTLVRDERVIQSEKQNGLHKALFKEKSLPGQTLNFELSDKVIEQLNELNTQGHKVNELLLQLLHERKQEIEERKEKLSQESAKTSSRYIPAEIRSILQEEYGQKCSIRSCLLPATNLHHTQRFSLSRTHDPKYLAPLCKAHHQIAHTVDKKVAAHWNTS